MGISLHPEDNPTPPKAPAKLTKVPKRTLQETRVARDIVHK